MAREGLMDDCGYNFDVDEDSYNSGFKDGFLTAIDEFAEKLLEEVEANPVDVGGRYSYMIPQSFLEGQIKDIAEQLKEE